MNLDLLASLRQTNLDGDGARDLLKQLKASDRFPWLKEILDLTLEEYLNQTLGEGLGVRPFFFDPHRVDENIQVMGTLLKSCLERTSTLYDLEYRAIGTAFELLLAEETVESDFSINQHLLRAASAQIFDQQTAQDAEYPDLKQKRDVVNAIRNLRTALHKTPDSPLNYGERTKLGRKLLALDIRTLYELSDAIRIGLAVGYGIRQELMSRAGPQHNRLANCATWYRNTIDALEQGDSSETTTDIHLYLGADEVFPGGLAELQKRLRSSTDADLRFRLNLEHLGLAHVPTAVPRLVALSLSPTFLEADKLFNDVAYNWGKATSERSYASDAQHFTYVREYMSRRRRQFSFTATVSVPRQGEALNVLDATEKPIPAWDRAGVRLSGLQPWADSTISESSPMFAPPQIVNTNPLGEWLVTFHNRVLTPIGPLPRGYLGTGWSRSEDQQLLEKIADLVITLKVAVRRAASEK